jgi:hypothetical protein
VLLAVAVTVGVSIVLASRPSSGAASEATLAPASGAPDETGSPRSSTSAPSVAPSVAVAASAAVTSSPSVGPSPSATPAPPAAPSPSSSSSPSVGPTVSPVPSAGVRTPAAVGPYPAQCVGWSRAVERADRLLLNRYRINTHPEVAIPADPTWTENPLGDANWEYQFHAQWLVLSLFQAWHASGDERYLEKATFLLRDWVQDNPRPAPRSAVAWDPMGTALRGQVLACASRLLPPGAWLTDALDAHGRTLADPGFYVGEGNWALNQGLGLLEIAAVRGRADWKELARSRLVALFEASVDAQGVTNEQSVYYQLYNYDRYRLVFARLEAAGLALPPSASRLQRMPQFLGYATLPNGEYEMIGDLDRMAARNLPGTAAEFAATKGASGTRPADTVAVYKAGWLFARSGWGERRPWADEVTLSLRFGPGPQIHGHADHGSITLYGYGSRLLIDPGKYTYNRDAWRSWFKGRTAHNVVTADGAAYDFFASSRLLDHSRNATMVTARVHMTGTAGVGHVRGITFSRNLDYVLVDDRLTSATRRTYRQLWHLTDDANPALASWWFRTQRSRGNVQVRQLITTGTTSRVVTGRTSPIQGWVAWKHGVRSPAPVVEVLRSGTNVRFLTLIVPAAGTPSAGVSELKLTSTGYSVVVKIGAKRERVVVNGSTVTITALP